MIMELKETLEGTVLKIKVKPDSGSFGFSGDILELKSRPEGGKANMEILKGLKKLFGKEVLILSGFKSREKVILVKGAGIEDVRKVLHG